MYFRLIKKNEISKCVELMTRAFKDYEYFSVCIKEKKRRYVFIREIMYLYLHTYQKSEYLMGCFVKDKLVAVTLLLTPGFKEEGIVKCIISGGLKVIAAGGLCETLSFLKMDKEANKVINSRKDEHWTVEILTVEPKYQGKGIGSKLIQNGIIPFVKKRGGKKIALITNSKRNSEFYKDNGLVLIDIRKVFCGKRSITNWSFERDV